MKRFKMFVISAMVAVASLAGMAAPMAFADTPVSDACGAINAGTDCGSSTGPTVESIIATVIRILSIVVGITAVIMIIVSGMKYITSGGDASSVSSAKSTLLYALIGLFIAASAQALVSFVLEKAK